MNEFHCNACGRNFESEQEFQVHKQATHSTVDEITGGGTVGTDTGVAKGRGGDILPEQSQDSLTEGSARA